MIVKNETTGVIYKPWRLDTAAQRTFNSLAMPAIRDEDHVNNVEQIVIDTPSVSSLKIEIKATILPSDSLSFYLVYEFITDSITVTYPNGGEPFVGGETEIIRWDAPLKGGTFDVDVSYDNGANWQILKTGLTATNFIWTVPTTVTGKARIRVTRSGSLTRDVSDEPFTIMPTVKNFHIASVCNDTTLLAWDRLSEAVIYEVSQLGDKYMDSIGQTSASFFAVRIAATDSAWFSIKAISADGGTSRRALAIPKPRKTTDCLATNLNEGPLSIPLLLASPNPSESGIFDIQLKNFNVKVRTINVFNAVGQVVFSKSMDNLSSDFIEQINLKNQAAGVYLLHVQTERRTYTLRLMKL
jgi:Secretion system C-terminal sorting domain